MWRRGRRIVLPDRGRREVERGSHAAEPSRREPRREAERNFVMWLQIAVAETTETVPTLTARYGKLGPFARMVQMCLRKAGAKYAEVAQLLNDLNRARRASSVVDPGRSWTVEE